MSLLNTASLIVTPNGYKEGTLYSVIPTNGAGDMSVVRATTATRVNSAGLVELVPYNLFTYSEQFNNADWIKQNSAQITANSTTSPNGTLTADLLYPSSTQVIVAAIQTFASINGARYSQSIYVKAAGKNFAALYTMNGSTGNAMWVNLTSGVITNGVGANVTNRFAENVGNGWWRIGFSDLGDGSTNYMIIYPTDSNSTLTATASGTDGIYVWGAQLVEGSNALDYQRTETRLNIPRLDYSNGTCPSLLVEPQRTNLALYSEQFDNAGWTKDGFTISANSTTSPNGNTTADKLVANAASGAKIVYQIIISAIGTAYTTSAYFKAGENNLAYIRIGGVTGNPYVIYNLSTQAVVSSGGGITHTIQLISNGWYKISATVTADTVFIAPVFSILPTTGYTLNGRNIPEFTGNGVNGGFVWGAQLEAGAYPTSYIPTTSASVTRNADSLYKTGATSLIGQTEGTFFFDYYASAKDADGEGFATVFIGGDGTNNFQLYSIGTDLYWYIRNATSVLIDQTANQVLVSGQRYKISIAYKSGDYALYINGVQKRISSVSGVPTISQFNFNATGYGASVAKVKNEFNSISFWKTRLTNAQLAQLTTI
jgi:hypothetical protein